MASDSVPEFVSNTENLIQCQVDGASQFTNPAVGRIYSGDTDESPFASNLVTPTDEDLYPKPGIHERLDVAKSLLGYFASRGSSEEANKIQEIIPLEAGDIKEFSPTVVGESPKMLNRVELEADGLLQVSRRAAYLFASLEAHGHSETRSS